MYSLAYITIHTLLISFGASAYWGPVPEDVRTFVITYPDSEERDYAALQVNGEWILDSTPDLSNNQQVTLIYDYPWQEPATHNTLFRNIRIDSEPRALRANRIEQGYKDADYVLMRLDTGVLPVQEQDIALAERAAAMAAEVNGSDSTPGEVGAYGATEAPGNEPGSSAAGFSGYRWGAHALVLLGLGLALFGIYRRFLAD